MDTRSPDQDIEEYMYTLSLGDKNFVVGKDGTTELNHIALFDVLKSCPKESKIIKSYKDPYEDADTIQKPFKKYAIIGKKSENSEPQVSYANIYTNKTYDKFKFKIIRIESFPNIENNKINLTNTIGDITRNYRRIYSSGHPVIAIPKKILKRRDKMNPDVILDSVKLFFQPRIADKSAFMKTIQKEIDKVSFEKFENEFPGTTKIITLSSESQNKKKCLLYDNKEVISFTTVFPYAEEVLSKASCIELDGSWALAPYVYCVPQAIVNNEAIPLGISITPTESLELYENFYMLYYHRFQKYFENPILSDEGTAIKSFCDKHGLQQFFCYRHLINKFGANTVLALVVSDLLYSLSEDDFKATYDNFLTFKDFIINDSIEKKNITKFKELFHIDSNWNYDMQEFKSQLYFIRASMGIPTCTNHAESFHNKAKMLLKNNNCLLLKLLDLKHYAVNRFFLFGGRRSLKEAIRKVKKEKEIDAYDGECKCQRKSFLAKLYGIPEFPCVHTIETFEEPEQSIFFNYDNIDSHREFIVESIDQPLIFEEGNDKNLPIVSTELNFMLEETRIKGFRLACNWIYRLAQKKIPEKAVNMLLINILAPLQGNCEFDTSMLFELIVSARDGKMDDINKCYNSITHKTNRMKTRQHGKNNQLRKTLIRRKLIIPQKKADSIKGHTAVPVTDHTTAPVADHTAAPVADHTAVPVEGHTAVLLTDPEKEFMKEVIYTAINNEKIGEDFFRIMQSVSSKHGCLYCSKNLMTMRHIKSGQEVVIGDDQ